MTSFKRPIRKSFTGTVVSDKMNKTRVISVERTVKDSLYGKVLRKESRFYAHDEGNETRVGDVVEISSTRPLSKLKRWRVSRVIEKSKA